MEVNKRTVEYWEKRFEQILIDNEKLAVGYEKKMAKIYEQVKLDTARELESFYQRYSTETGLDLLEVRKRLNPKQLKNFKTQQQIYLTKVKELIEQGADLGSYEAVLSKLSGRAQVSRLQEIQNNLNTQIMILNGQQQIALNGVLTQAYLQGYLKSTFALQQGLGFGTSFTVPPNDDVAKILKTPWNGNNYSSSIWKNKQKLTNWLGTDLPRHFAAGSSVQEMSKDLSGKLGSSYNDAVRLVRTEVNYISNQSSMDAYEDGGVVEKYQICATLDNRTSEICRDMDGEIFKVKERQVSVNMPPFHVRCRTTTIPYFDDDDYEGLTRIARGEDGKSYFVPADMTYREWEKQYVNYNNKE
jgi:SPP1 gp7 family putative phage head morphogenesis protein